MNSKERKEGDRGPLPKTSLEVIKRCLDEIDATSPGIFLTQVLLEMGEENKAFDRWWTERMLNSPAEEKLKSEYSFGAALVYRCQRLESMKRGEEPLTISPDTIEAFSFYEKNFLETFAKTKEAIGKDKTEEAYKASVEEFYQKSGYTVPNFSEEDPLLHQFLKVWEYDFNSTFVTTGGSDMFEIFRRQAEADKLAKGPLPERIVRQLIDKITFTSPGRFLTRVLNEMYMDEGNKDLHAWLMETIFSSPLEDEAKGDYAFGAAFVYKYMSLKYEEENGKRLIISRSTMGSYDFDVGNFLNAFSQEISGSDKQLPVEIERSSQKSGFTRSDMEKEDPLLYKALGFLCDYHNSRLIGAGGLRMFEVFQRQVEADKLAKELWIDIENNISLE